MMLPHFDWSISVGNVLSVFSFIVAFWLAASRVYNGIDRRVLAFEALLLQHAQTLTAHTLKMEKQDDILLRLVGDMQRLIGRVDGSQQNMDRAELAARALLDVAAVNAKEMLAIAAATTAAATTAAATAAAAAAAAGHRRAGE